MPGEELEEGKEGAVALEHISSAPRLALPRLGAESGRLTCLALVPAQWMSLTSPRSPHAWPGFL